jgi:glycosyltransferase involved in cell wall biosynthesis
MSTNIIVGIPAYNEERAIADVVARALPYASAVVVVDDGSVDKTSSEAVRAGATVIRHQDNSGKGVAIATLFQYAIDHGAGVLVLLDGDGQHDPDEIPAVIAPCIESMADVVVGSRFHADSESHTPRIRRLGQLAFNGLTAIASGVRCSDSQSGFRAFNRRAFCAMRLSETSFSVESEMQFECRAHGLVMAEVPISCDYMMPPKRNVLAHGMLVLSRLTTMAIERRAFGQGPAVSSPSTPRTIVANERLVEGVVFEARRLTTSGD